MRREDGGDRVLWRNVIVLTLGWVIWSPLQQAAWLWFQPFVFALGGTALAISLIFTAGAAVLIVARLFGGYLADSIGRKQLIVPLTYVVALSYLGFALAPSWTWLIVVNAIQNLALLYQPALSAILADSLPPRARGRGYALTSVIPGAASILAPVLALVVYSKVGDLVKCVRMLFTLACLGGLVVATLRLFLLVETLPSRRRLKLEEILSGYRQTFRYVMSRARSLVLYMLLLALINALIYLTPAYVMLYLGVRENTWALMSLVGTATAFACQVPAGFITDRVGRKPPLVLGTALGLVSTLILALSPRGSDVWLYVLAATVIGSAAFGLSSNALSAMEADVLAAELRGKGYSLLLAFNDTTAIVGVLVAGTLYDYLSPRMPFIVASAVSLVALGVALRLPETIGCAQ